MERYVIDRFEGDIAVLVSQGDSSVKNIKRSCLPKDAKNGLTVFENAGTWQIDSDDSLARKERIRQKMAEVFRRL